MWFQKMSINTSKTCFYHLAFRFSTFVCNIIANCHNLTKYIVISRIGEYNIKGIFGKNVF